MNHDLLTEAKHALSLAGWQIIDEPVWPGAEDSFLARRNYWGRGWMTPVVCAQPSATDLRSLVTDLDRYFADLGDVDFREVLVIVDSAEMCDKNPVTLTGSSSRIVVQTPDQLLRSSIDFQPYLSSLARAYDESPDGLANYYVRPFDVAGIDIENELIDWIAGSESPGDDDSPSPLEVARPVAILGAYGIGKSSFATRIASQLAQAALADPDRRIPILIRLGELSGEQTLEGLLGKHFTATHQINGYSFGAFEALNRRGHLVVILDGFDEMKQLLSWREFRYNLVQLNRLQIGASRLVILGRPTAFENDAQYQHALHGRRQVGTRLIQEEGWPDYQELELAPLNSEQISGFTERYLIYRDSPLVSDEKRMLRLRGQLKSPQLKDIARRPVQLRMLVEILPEYHGAIENLDIARIYDIFIDQLIDEVIAREERKHSRLAFSAADRRQFLTSFAYWLWNARDAGIVTTDMIPEVLVEPFAKGEEIETVRRDLVAGSPLDRRVGERIRFPHRSFQEFLVAETIWKRLRSGDLTLAEADHLITAEVAEFMELQRGSAEETLAQRLLPMLDSPIRLRTCSAVFLNEQVVSGLYRRMLDRGSNQPLNNAELLMIALWTHRNPSSEKRIRLDDVLQVKSASSIYLLMCGLLVDSGSRRDGTSLVELLGAMAIQTKEVERITAQRVKSGSVVLLHENWVAKAERDGIKVGRITGKAHIRVERQGKQEIVEGENIAVRWMTDFSVTLCQKVRFVKNGTSLDIRGLRPHLASLLSRGPFVSDWIRNDALDPTIVRREEFLLAPDAAIRTAVSEMAAASSRIRELAEAGRLSSAELRA